MQKDSADKKYNIGTHILTCGRVIISDHIEYIFNMIAQINAKDQINQIVFNENLPEKQFGSFHGPSRSLCVNITAHLAHNLAKVKDTNPSMSIKALLIMELVNTALHEARHATFKDETNNFEDIETDEEENICQAFADENMWEAGKYLDLEVQSFGPFIDKELLAFFKELKEAKNTDTFHSWQLSQLNMLEKDILFLDEENDVVIKTMRELCAYFSKTTNWDDAYVTPHVSNQTVEPVTAADDCPFDVNIYLHHPESESLLIETDRKKADEMLESEGLLTEISKEQFDKLDVQYKAEAEEYRKKQAATAESGPTICQYEDYDPLDDCATEIVYPDKLPEMVAFPSPTEVEHGMSAQTTVVEEPVTAQTVAPVTGDIRAISEMVLRRLFTHMYSKCEYDGKGNFANPAAVIEAVPIDDIAGATDLFQKMDTADGMGVYKPQQGIGAYITGLISKEGNLPYYRLYINQGGQLHRRTFIPQNPNKMKDNNLTNWALKVRDGWRIAMLLSDTEGPKLDIKTEPGQLLGQETFNPWNAAK